MPAGQLRAVDPETGETCCVTADGELERPPAAAEHDSEPLRRRLVAEAVGTGFLVIAVVGSGIMAQRLSPSDHGLQLLENAIATGAALAALILVFGPISGAHFNPVVTLVALVDGAITRFDAMPVSWSHRSSGAASARSWPT